MLAGEQPTVRTPDAAVDPGALNAGQGSAPQDPFRGTADFGRLDRVKHQLVPDQGTGVLVCASTVSLPAVVDLGAGQPVPEWALPALPAAIAAQLVMLGQRPLTLDDALVLGGNGQFVKA